MLVDLQRSIFHLSSNQHIQSHEGQMCDAALHEKGGGRQETILEGDEAL